MSLKRRLESLEARSDAGPKVRWANMHATRVEDIVPDGVIEWSALFVPRPAELPDPAAEAVTRLKRMNAMKKLDRRRLTTPFDLHLGKTMTSLSTETSIGTPAAP